MGCLVALSGISCQERVENSDNLPLSGPPGGFVRYIILGERVILADSNDVLPLSGSPGGFVRYIIPGEGSLMEDYCIKILHWSCRSGYKVMNRESINQHKQ